MWLNKYSNNEKYCVNYAAKKPEKYKLLTNYYTI